MWRLWAAQALSYRPAEQLPSPLLSTLRNFSVEMYFRNESNKAPWPLILPGCPHRCPLQDFLHLTEPVVPKDWQQECQLASGPADTGEWLPASTSNLPKQPSFPAHRSPKSCCPSSHLTAFP